MGLLYINIFFNFILIFFHLKEMIYLPSFSVENIMGLQIWKWVQNGHKMIKIKVNHLVLVFKGGSTIQVRLILSLSWISYWRSKMPAIYLLYVLQYFESMPIQLVHYKSRARRNGLNSFLKSDASA